MNETRVLDEHVVQPNVFIEGERVLSRVQNGTPPSLETIARRPLAFDLEAGTAVGEQEKARGSRD